MHNVMEYDILQICVHKLSLFIDSFSLLCKTPKAYVAYFLCNVIFHVLPNMYRLFTYKVPSK